jgi:hypothetical protein
MSRRAIADMLAPVAALREWVSARRLGTLAVIAVAALMGWAYLRVALPSLAHPFGLEWMEGGTVDVVARIVDGRPIYTRASLEYVPYIYPPLYFLVSAGVASVLGVDFLAPRLVSFASTLGATWLIGRWVAAETKQPVAGIAASTLYVGCYELCGRWFHLARVDALYVLLVLASLRLLGARPSRRTDLGCGLVIAAAVATKQTALLALAPVGLWVMAADWRRAARIFGTATAIVAPVTIVWQIASDGELGRFLWALPRSHPLATGHLLGVWTSDLRPAWPLCLLTIAAVTVLRPADRHGRWFWVATLVGLLGSAQLARMHSGADVNALMPAAAALSIGGGLALGRTVSRAEARGKDGPVVLAAAGLLVAQLLWLGPPDPTGRPTQQHVRRGERFVEFLRELPGDVLLPDHRFVQTRAGKTSYGLGMAAADVLRVASPGDARRALQAEIRTALAEERFSHVLLSVRSGWISEQVAARYCFAYRIDLAPAPLAGARHRPRWVYVPRGSPQCRAAPPP